jgi:hypothetical protein
MPTRLPEKDCGRAPWGLFCLVKQEKKRVKKKKRVCFGGVTDKGLGEEHFGVCFVLLALLVRQGLGEHFGVCFVFAGVKGSCKRTGGSNFGFVLFFRRYG